MTDKDYTITKTSALAFSLAFLFANLLFAQNDLADSTLGGGGDNQNPTQSAIDSSANQNPNTIDSANSSESHSTRIPLTHAYDLGRIERTVKSQVDSNDSAVSITSEEIDATNSNNIAEALRYQTGVFYHPASGSRGEPDINIRGFGVTQIGFFLDGIPVHSIYDKQTDWGQFSTYGISEMSISKGYTSPQYGMNTMGGAVNMITSKPMDKLEVTLKYGFISNNEHQVSVSLGSNLGQYYVQATYSFDRRESYPLSHKFSPTTNQPNLEAKNSYFTNHTLRFKLGFEPNENHEYSLNLIYQKGDKGGILSTTSGSYWKWPHYDKITAYILGHSRFNDTFSLDSRIFYDHFYNLLNVIGEYKNGNVSQGTNFATKKSSSKYDDHTWGVIETLNMDFSDNINLKVGLNLKQDSHNSYDPDAYSDPRTHLMDLSTSIFAEYAQRFNDMFRLMLSASYDRNDMLQVIISDSRRNNYSLQGGTAQAIFYGDWNENITSWLNVGYKTSLPTLKDRYSSMWGGVTPNPSLQPESAINAEFGTKLNYNTTLGTSSAEIAVYYNHLTDMLSSVADTTNSCVRGNNCQKMINVETGYSYGVEVGFSQGFWSDKIVFGANYTYQAKKANKNSSDYNIKGKILNYPEHIANAMLSLTQFSQWDLIANLTYQSPQWDYSSNSITYTKIKSTLLVDLKTNLRIIDGLQLSLGVSNVFDALYYYSEGYYMPGRRIFLSVEYKY